MSLVNEALKKARVEAARQEANDKGIPVQALPSHLPPEQRRRDTWPFVLGSLALVIIALLTWIAFRPQAQPASSMSGSAAYVGDGTPEAQPLGRQTVGEVAQPSRTSSPLAGSSPAGARAESASQPVTPRASDVPPKSGRSNPLSGRQLDLPTEPLPATQETARREAKAQPSGTEAADEDTSSQGRTQDGPNALKTPTTHRLVAELPDGQRLKLAGIAWSSDNPFAVINGQMLGTGEAILGFTIESIEPTIVTLSNGEQTIQLRSR